MPGLALAVGIGVASVGLAHVLPPSPYASDVIFALFLGALVVNTPLARLIGLGALGKEREPDRYAAGLRYTGKWILRLAIIAMGLKVQTSFFGRGEIFLVFGTAAVSMTTAFYVAHVMGTLLGVRSPLVDLLAGGTMICGASAVNAIAPVVGAHPEELGVAAAVLILFGVVAIDPFPPAATFVGIDPAHAGIWSGLAVNDLSSAIAVGAQMDAGTDGAVGGVMAAASKSARILLLAPVMIGMALLRSKGKAKSLQKSIVDSLPGFLAGYVGLAIVRAIVDRVAGDAPTWHGVLAVDKIIVDVLMAAVSAGIGLHLSLKTILGSSARSVVVGGVSSFWTALISLALITAAARGASGVAIGIGVVAFVVAYLVYRTLARDEVRLALLKKRFDAGGLVTLAEATSLLESAERGGPLQDPFMRRLLDQLSPAIGELIPARTSPLPHGEGCRWMTYWEGKSGWALVAVVREPGSMTPIHAHPHRLLGKAIEGVLEEMRFEELDDGAVKLLSREVLAHEALVEADGLATLHVVRAHGATPAIDLQLRGPEVGKPGRRFRLDKPIDLTSVAVGSRIAASEEIDDRPGHGGEGAAAGRVPEPPRSAG